MAQVLTTFSALFASVLLLTIGSGLFGTFLSLRMTLQGFSQQITGLILAGYYAGLVVGGLFCQGLVQRVGHIRAFAAFAALTTAAIMGHALYLSALSWGMLRFVTGISMTGLFMVVESWLNEVSEPSNRGRVFSFYMILNYLGMGIGQFMLNLSDIRGTDHFLIAGVLFSLCLVPVVATRSVNPKMPQRIKLNIVGLFRQAPIGMAGCLTAGLLNGSFYAMGPVFALKSGLAVADVAWFMSISIFSGLMLQWPVGIFSDRLDRRRFLAAISAAVAVISLVIALFSENSRLLLFVMAIAYGGTVFTLYPVSVALTHDLVAPKDVVPASSALILFYGVGAFFGPVLASATMQRLGPEGLYFFLASGSALFALAAYVRWKKTPVDVKDPVPFMPMSRTSPVAAVLDPREKPPAETLQ
jgi:MFS family permease